MAEKMNEIEIAVGKAKKKPPFLGGSDPDKDEDTDEGADDKASEDEVSLMKEFDKASSPEARASALRTFIKRCTEGYSK